MGVVAGAWAGMAFGVVLGIYLWPKEILNIKKKLLMIFCGWVGVLVGLLFEWLFGALH